MGRGEWKGQGIVREKGEEKRRTGRAGRRER